MSPQAKAILQHTLAAAAGGAVTAAVQYLGAVDWGQFGPWAATAASIAIAAAHHLFTREAVPLAESAATRQTITVVGTAQVFVDGKQV